MIRERVFCLFGGRWIADRRLNFLIGVLLIFGCLHTVWLTVSPLFDCPAASLLSDWPMSDWLINFSNGFVRRGLGGWLLERVCLATGAASPHLPLWAVCWCAFAAVWLIMLVRFRQRGWCWWLLCSPLVCGLSVYLTRKDYLLFLMLAAAVWLLRSQSAGATRRIAAILLTLVALLLHESCLFWFAPVVTLLLRGWWRWFAAVLFTAAFALCCVFSGSAETARIIVEHWNGLYPSTGLTLVDDSNLGALGWQLRDTLRYHFHSNFQPGFPFWLITLAGAYYLITQFLRVFSPQKFTDADAARLGGLLTVLFFTLLPMLSLLSCDMARVVQYGCLSAVMVAAIVQPSRLDGMLPAWLTQRIGLLNKRLTALLPPSRGLLLLVLLLLASSTAEFNPSSAWFTSLFYNIVYPPFDWLCILTTAQ